MKTPLSTLMFILSGVVAVLIQKAHAEEISAVEKNLPPKTLTAFLLIDTSSTLAPQTENSAGEGMSYSGLYRFDLSVPLSNTLTANMRVGYSQEYSYVLPNGSSNDLTDMKLGLTQVWGEIRKDFTLAVGPSLYLPTSYESKRAGMKSAVSIDVLAQQKVGNFVFALGPSVTELFHDVEVQLDGTPNNQTSLSLLMEVDYAILDNLTLSAAFQPSHSWTYFGTAHDKYLLDYDLTYDVSKHLSLSIGIYNKASALKSNGLDYNYVLYDQAQFMGYFDVLMKL